MLVLNSAYDHDDQMTGWFNVTFEFTVRPTIDFMLVLLLFGQWTGINRRDYCQFIVLMKISNINILQRDLS